MLFKRLFKNRIAVLLFAAAAMFTVVTVRLYLLQILNGEEYEQSTAATVIRSVSTSSPRGTIYDRYRRILAQDKVMYNAVIDLSTEKSGSIEEVESLLKALNDYGIEYNADELPIIKTENGFEFDFSSEEAEKRWKTDLGLDDDISEYTAEETYNYMKEYF